MEEDLVPHRAAVGGTGLATCAQEWEEVYKDVTIVYRSVQSGKKYTSIAIVERGIQGCTKISL